MAVGVLIVAVIVAASQMVEAPSRTLETVRGEQLLTVAERLMDKILLTPGYPPDWGSDVNVNRVCKPSEAPTGQCLSDFGLAMQGGAPYIVDPDKVMRLANLSALANPIPLSAENLTCLLGLGECDREGNVVKVDYGFRLVMKPMITAQVEVLDWLNGVASKLRVRVVNWLGEGVPNANVAGAYVVALIAEGLGSEPGTAEIIDVWDFTKSCITDALGWCEFDFASDVSSIMYGSGEQPASFIALRIEWEGFVTVSVHPLSQVEAPLTGYIFGDYVFVEKDVDATVQPLLKGQISGAAIMKDEVIQVVARGRGPHIDPTEVKWCRGQPDDPAWCHEVAGRVLPSRRGAYLIGKVVYLEKLPSHVVLFAKWRGSWNTIVISRIPVVDILSYGLPEAKPANSVTLTRVTQIYGYPYVVQLTVWRAAEG